MRDTTLTVLHNAVFLTQEICLQKLAWIEQQLQIAPSGWEDPRTQRLLENQFFFQRALDKLRRGRYATCNRRTERK